MSIKQLINECGSGYKSPVYLIWCEDDFLYTEAMNIIRGGGEQIVDIFDLFDTSQQISMGSIIDLLNTVSLFSQRQIVVIRNFQKIGKEKNIENAARRPSVVEEDKNIGKDKRDKKAGKGKLESFINYIKSPSANSVLFIFHKKVKDKNKGFKDSAVVDSLISSSKDVNGKLVIEVIDINITKKDLPAWIVSKAEALGITISKEAAAFMSEIYGDNLGMLSNELEKLSLLGKKDRAYTIDDVSEVFYGEKEGNTFQLTEKIVKRDKVKAIEILNLVISKTDPLMLLGALNWKLSTIHDTRLVKCLEILIDTEMRLKGSNPTLPLDWTTLKLIEALR